LCRPARSLRDLHCRIASEASRQRPFLDRLIGHLESLGLPGAFFSTFELNENPRPITSSRIAPTMDASIGCSTCSTSSQCLTIRVARKPQGDQCDRRSIRPLHPARHSCSHAVRPEFVAKALQEWIAGCRCQDHSAGGLSLRSSSVAWTHRLSSPFAFTVATVIRESGVGQPSRRCGRNATGLQTRNVMRGRYWLRPCPVRKSS
jgi:hypothetical protein